MRKNPVIAIVLSLLPGAGQLYIGKIKRGLALFCVDAGIVMVFFFSHSVVLSVLALFIYFVTMIPAGFEAYQVSKTGRSVLALDSKIYVVMMLLMTGFSALPLLWQNRQFSRHAKITLTVAVPVLAILFFGILAFFGPRIDGYFKGK